MAILFILLKRKIGHCPMVRNMNAVFRDSRGEYANGGEYGGVDGDVKGPFR